MRLQAKKKGVALKTLGAKKSKLADQPELGDSDLEEMSDGDKKSADEANSCKKEPSLSN